MAITICLHVHTEFNVAAATFGGNLPQVTAPSVC